MESVIVNIIFLLAAAAEVSSFEASSNLPFASLSAPPFLTVGFMQYGIYVPHRALADGAYGATHTP